MDSAVAHLAGALGKPCLLLLPSPPDWRWGLHGTTTPWCPGMSLFRQGADRQWAPVVACAAEALLQGQDGR